MDELVWNASNLNESFSNESGYNLTQDVSSFNQLNLRLGESEFLFKSDNILFKCKAVKRYGISSSGRRNFLGLAVKIWPIESQKVSFIIESLNKKILNIKVGKELNEFQRKLGLRLFQIKGNEELVIQMNGKYIISCNKKRRL